MRTGDIDEQVILGSVRRTWVTAREVVEQLDASPSALRKVTSLLFVLEGVNVLEGRARKSEVGRKGRPPREFRRSPNAAASR